MGRGIRTLIESDDEYVVGAVVDRPIVCGGPAGEVAVVVAIAGDRPAAGARLGPASAESLGPEEPAFRRIAMGEGLAEAPVGILATAGQDVTRSVLEAGQVEGLVPTARTELARPEHVARLGDPGEEGVTVPTVRSSVL